VEKPVDKKGGGDKRGKKAKGGKPGKPRNKQGDVRTKLKVSSQGRKKI